MTPPLTPETALRMVDDMQRRLADHARIFESVELLCELASDTHHGDPVLLEGIAVIARRASEDMDQICEDVGILWDDMSQQKGGE